MERFYKLFYTVSNNTQKQLTALALNWKYPENFKCFSRYC